MRNMQTPNGKDGEAGVKTAKAFALSLVACFLLILPGCRNPFQTPAVPENDGGMGTFLLTIGEQRQARMPTVRPPELSMDDFERFDLHFTRGQWCSTDNAPVSEVDWQKGDPVSLPFGTWDLRVTAFVAGDYGLIDVAQGRLLNLWVGAGETVSGNVVLAPIPHHPDYFPHMGELHWHIRHAGVELNLARMDITRLDRHPDGELWGSFHFIGGYGDPDQNPGHRLGGLEAGQYRAVVTLRNLDNELVVVGTIVHVYRGMRSYVDFEFTNDHFQIPLLDTILALWNEAGDLQDIFAGLGIFAGHFEHLGVNGVNAGNFEGLVYWFNAFRDRLTPTCLTELKTLIDVARLGVYSRDDSFLAVAHEHRGAASSAIEALTHFGIGNGNGITRFMWTGARTVEAHIAGVVVGFEFAGDIPVGMHVPHATLVEQLDWLRNNAQAGNTYIVEITGSEFITPAEAALPTYITDLTVILRGVGPGPSYVKLSANGNLFSVGSGVTLVLDENVTLVGRSANGNGSEDNFTSVVSVVYGGTLIMNERSKITGNTGWSGGVSIFGGTFIMYGGEVSGNTGVDAGGVSVGLSAWGGVGTFVMRGGEVSGNTGRDVGGVTVSEGMLFVMYGGEVSGNTGNSSHIGGGVVVWGTFVMRGGEVSGNIAYGSGGGVHISANGTFVMHGGEVSRNTAGSGGGVNISANGMFAMHGGKVSGNIASGSGGGVNANGTFTVYGGEISGNTATSGGGGVNVSPSWSSALQDVVGGTFVMLHGGEIFGNIAFNGGGVNVGNGCTFNMRGGTVFGNTATGWDGGGVFNSGTFRISDGTIYGNEVENGDYGNTASDNGASLSGTALVGTFDDAGLFVEPANHTLTTTNYTIKVEGGVWLNPPPAPVITITAQPAAETTVTAGSISGSLTVAASVTPAASLSFQWFSNTTNSNVGGTAISGETGSSFAIPTGLAVGTHFYFVEVSAAGADSVRSNVAVVNVSPAPIPVITITAQPAPTTNVTVGSISGSLTAAANVTGGAYLSYQWFSNTTNSNAGGTAISGATGLSFAIPTGLSVGTHYYFVEVRATGGAASVRSNVAVVNVSPPCNLIHIASGTFRMGLCQFMMEAPLRYVTLSGFYMSSFQVTQGEWYDVMGTHPSYFTGDRLTGGETWRKLPVERVSWYDAIVFSNRLSIASGLTPAYSINGSTNPDTWGPVPTGSDATWNSVVVVPGSTGYRLPTEAQWEFAARGGHGSPGNFMFSGNDAFTNVAWGGTNSGGRTHEVGTRQPNALGLYDMSGNVWEWVWDWLGTYPTFDETDPVGAPSGVFRVTRGGCWNTGSIFLRSVARDRHSPPTRNSSIGFRLVRPAHGEAPFVPVTGITGVPTSTQAGIPLALTGTVSPANATDRAIVWSVQSAGTTGATLSGHTLNTAAAGTATVRATITNGFAVGTSFMQDFAITVAPAPVITITVQPAATTNVVAGSISGSLTVAASVTQGAPLSYQWFSNTTNSNIGGTAIDGATGSSFAIPAGLAAGTHFYFVEVRSGDVAVPVRSNVAVVNVGFTVNFNMQGGTPQVPTQTVSLNGLAARPTPNPTRAGHVFRNWYADSAGTALFDFNALATSNRTAYAQWSILSFQNWTSIPSGTTGSTFPYGHIISGIAYGNGTFIAANFSSSNMARSTDGGVTWIAIPIGQLLGEGVSFQGITFGSGTFIAVGSQGRMVRSTDGGVTWAIIPAGMGVGGSTFPLGADGINGIAYGNGTFVAVGDLGRMARSTDGGVTWTAIPSGAGGSTFPSQWQNRISGITYANGTFIAVGDMQMARSTDGGVTWIAVSNTAFSGTTIDIRGITYGNGTFIAVGWAGRMSRSIDGGITWTAIPSGTDAGGSTFTPAQWINGIAYGNGTFVAVGHQGRMAFSIDLGITWTAIPAGWNNSTFTQTISNIAFGSGRFIAVGPGMMARYTVGE